MENTVKLAIRYHETEDNHVESDGDRKVAIKGKNRGENYIDTE